jgi:hypothetical protein
MLDTDSDEDSEYADIRKVKSEGESKRVLRAPNFLNVHKACRLCKTKTELPGGNCKPCDAQKDLFLTQNYPWEEGHDQRPDPDFLHLTALAALFVPPTTRAH